MMEQRLHSLHSRHPYYIAVCEDLLYKRLEVYNDAVQLMYVLSLLLLCFTLEF